MTVLPSTAVQSRVERQASPCATEPSAAAPLPSEELHLHHNTHPLALPPRRQCLSMTFLRSTGIVIEPVDLRLDAEGEAAPQDADKPPSAGAKPGAKAPAKPDPKAAADAAAAAPPSMAAEIQAVIDSCKVGGGEGRVRAVALVDGKLSKAAVLC